MSASTEFENSVKSASGRPARAGQSQGPCPHDALCTEGEARMGGHSTLVFRGRDVTPWVKKDRNLGPLMDV